MGSDLRAAFEGKLFLAKMGPFPAIPFVLVTVDFLPLLESGFGRAMVVLVLMNQGKGVNMGSTTSVHLLGGL